MTLGYTGRARAPARLVVDLGDGPVLFTPLSVTLRHIPPQALEASGVGARTARLSDGATYWLLGHPVPVEVDHGTTSDATI
ncbi:hypothetical protein [Streptomyces aureocirculatus]|uniref:hypothetical protein n=1 Tax=Streptomyces aureocirculatus TaxID=67275 RepID=UPI0004C8B833|nr:hypothetical protein [Streptomyces aureocirculatus]